MASPRSEAGTFVTRWPSIRISPPLTCSRPAMMRSSVDLPQPEGPTNTTNSPSCDGEVDAMNASSRAVGLLDVDELEVSHGSTMPVISSRYWRCRW